MSRKLVMLFDGTWNDEDDQTNVFRLKECLNSVGPGDINQPCYYDTGVGTDWMRRWRGGAFGLGLSKNIRDGYAWLSEKHIEGDELYFFGFSRGAYTARSLVGLIRKCGVLQNPVDQLVRQAYDIYRVKTPDVDNPEAVAFRKTFSREVLVKFIGVWDTVGALGVPASNVPFSRDKYKWHDTELSKIVENAYHAMAIDERRKDYDVTVWTKSKPQNKNVEQRWFIGAHANVGGGFRDARLASIPLAWIQGRAAACGLQFRTMITPSSDAATLGEIHKSYESFMFKIYKRFRRPYTRPFGRGVNETVDPSVWARWNADTHYRPLALVNYPDRPCS